MKKFKFNLETILRIRTKYEERVKEEFNDQRRRVEEQKEMIVQIISERNKTEDQIKAARTRQVDIDEHRSFDSYLQWLKTKLEEAKAELELLEAELERRREVLVKAQKDVKILEKLREHRFEDYRKILNKEEQAFLDEIAMTRPKG